MIITVLTGQALAPLRSNLKPANSSVVSICERISRLSGMRPTHILKKKQYLPTRYLLRGKVIYLGRKRVRQEDPFRKGWPERTYQEGEHPFPSPHYLRSPPDPWSLNDPSQNSHPRHHMELQAARGHYASYWKAFFLSNALAFILKQHDLN